MLNFGWQFVSKLQVSGSCFTEKDLSTHPVELPVIDDAASQGLKIQVMKLSEVKKGFVLLPGRWVIERSFAWTARFRRLARDFERLAETLAGYHFLAFTTLLLHRFFTLQSVKQGPGVTGTYLLSGA